mmetsp:Transcript_22091/g.46670  ORF Transcript_22091/g.46670 Transcript_22091/m.46670 type:complete len:104 (+) Transcript_22091:578-889(+)
MSLSSSAMMHASCSKLIISNASSDGAASPSSVVDAHECSASSSSSSLKTGTRRSTQILQVINHPINDVRDLRLGSAKRAARPLGQCRRIWKQCARRPWLLLRC